MTNKKVTNSGNFSQGFKDGSYGLSYLSNDLKSFFENNQRVSAYVHCDDTVYPIESFKRMAFSANCDIVLTENRIDILQRAKIYGLLKKNVNELLYTIPLDEIQKLDFLIGKSIEGLERPGITFFFNIILKDHKVFRLHFIGLNAAILIYNCKYLKNVTMNVNPVLVPLLDESHLDVINEEIFQIIDQISLIQNISKI